MDIIKNCGFGLMIRDVFVCHSGENDTWCSLNNSWKSDQSPSTSLPHITLVKPRYMVVFASLDCYWLRTALPPLYLPWL